MCVRVHLHIYFQLLLCFIARVSLGDDRTQVDDRCCRFDRVRGYRRDDERVGAFVFMFFHSVCGSKERVTHGSIPHDVVLLSL